MTERDIPPAALRLLALCAGAIGLAGSGIGSWLFSQAIRQQVQDPGVQAALVGTAAVFASAEMLVFALAGLLQGDAHKSIRKRLFWAGAVLVMFQAVSIFGSQFALISGDRSREQADETRIAELRESINRQRQTAAALVEAGRLSGRSLIASSRQAGLDAMREAAAIEAQVLAQSAELARLQAGQAPSQTSIFGELGAMALGLVRAVLLSGVGLGMVSLAGVLWRMSRSVTPPATHPAPAPTEKPASPATAGLQPEPVGVPVPESVAVPMAETQPVPDRYQVIRLAVISGELKPSVRSLQSRFGGSTTTARQHLDRLHDEGVIQDQGPGRGYCLAASSPTP